ncbi:F-box only 11 [Paramuricea clavata]|uniref:F-box only 11, partial n=1 Tax=Paramuricea clavata TaxID=317549 RepID=A0A6S7IZV9_PARCT|nr:F-box only 11 [Paramuricea clavata]
MRMQGSLRCAIIHDVMTFLFNILFQDFFYKQMRKLRVFKSPQELITARTSLLAVSNQYGVVYVAGENNCVKAIKVETVEKLFIELQGSLQVEGHISTPYFQCQLSDEVLLNLFSFLPAKDICTLSCVCQRFMKICKDSKLWEQLYKSIFGFDYPLKMNDRRLYERIPRGTLTKDSWHEAFIPLYHSHHVVCKESQKKCDHVKYHSSLKEAIKSVHTNGIIIVHPGIYREELIIEKTVTIIGTGSEDKPEVTIEGSNATVVKFVSGSSTSYIRNISIKHVGGNSASFSPSCVDIGPDCCPTIHRCNVTSKASVGSTIYVHGKNTSPLVINCSITNSENVRINDNEQFGVSFYDNAGGVLENNEIFNHNCSGIEIRTLSNPHIRWNKIWGCEDGVSVHEQGRGLLEENEIFDSVMTGVLIETESDPTLRRNKIHDSQEVGICMIDGGNGILENNDIFRNAKAGVLICLSSFPVLRGNRIFEGGTTGIVIRSNAGGVLESNEIFNNKFTGICLATGVKPQLSNNNIYDNKELVKSTIESGRCLYTVAVSDKACNPMHDLYRCNTCGGLDDPEICVNCIKQCHQGHDVEFVRRDTFTCFCGWGRTGATCQLLEDSGLA